MRQLILAGIAASMCGGCAVMNPYVHPRDEHGKEILPDTPEFVGGITEAVEYADRWRITYRKAAAQHTVMRNTSAAVILPLSAASLFYGITGHGSSDRIARMAIGSAGLYGANQFLTSEPRQALYLEGAKALECAITHSRPLMVTSEWRSRLVTGADTLTDLNAGLAKATARLRGEIASADTLPDNDVTKSELKAAAAAVTSAEQTSQKAVEVAKNASAAVRAVDLSGQSLHAATRRIVDAVNLEIGKTVPDLDALKSVVGGLAGQAESFGQSYLPQPETPEPDPSRKDRADPTPATDGARLSWAISSVNSARSDLESHVARLKADKALTDADRKAFVDKIDELEARLAKLEREISRLKARLDAYDRTQNLRNARLAVNSAQAEVLAEASIVNARLAGMDDLARKADEVFNCKASEATTPFTVLPSGDTLTIRKEKSATLTAQGGTLTPRFQLVGVNTDKIKVDQVAQTSSVLVLTITAGKDTVAAAAAPTLVLTDGSGKKSVQVKVVVTD